jgi:hypothetical protein
MELKNGAVYFNAFHSLTPRRAKSVIIWSGAISFCNIEHSACLISAVVSSVHERTKNER